MANKYPCKICKRDFGTRYNLIRHCKNLHPDQDVDHEGRKVSIDCPKCEYKGNCFNNSVAHLKEKHDISMDQENLCFDDAEEFFKWKSQIEYETQANFIKKNAGKTFPDKRKSTIYYCRRSGHFSSKTERRRKLKKQGSVKMNAFCPARIRSLFQTDGKVDVEFIKTHVGHDNDICYVNLSRDVRELIAKKISQRKSCSKIIEELRLEGKASKRVELLTKQDLYNIEKEFNVSKENINPEKKEDDSMVEENESNDLSEMVDCDIKLDEGMSIQDVDPTDDLPLFSIPDMDEIVEGKLKLINDFTSLVTNITSMEELEFVDLQIKNMVPVIDAFKTGNVIEVFTGVPQYILTETEEINLGQDIIVKVEQGGESDS